MSALPQLDYITEEEYRDGEEISRVKHEWFNGVVYAMAGGTLNHAKICANTTTSLQNALRGKRCTAVGSELRIKVESNGLHTYPDAVVFCPPSRFIGKGDSTLLTPKIIFEVLSESTENYDRTTKFNSYKTIPTLEEYVLIEQNRVWVDHFRRTNQNAWLHESYTALEDVLRLESVEIEIPLTQIYEDLELPNGLIALAPTPKDDFDE